MTTLTLSIYNSSSSSPSADLWRSDAGIGDDAVQLPPSMPAASRYIPPLTNPEQAYFWRADWQAAEREAEAELARGEGPIFTTVEDGIRWLLSAE